MKIAPAQINAFLQKPDPAARVILFYGPDVGLARERADMLAKKTVPDIHDPFRTAQLTGSAIADDTARLHDEVAAQALGGGTRLVRIQSATESVASALKSLLEDWPRGDCLLLIEAGDLDKRSKLRALCENSDIAATLPCYVEEGAARTRIVSDILHVENLGITRDALAFLVDVLPPDRQAMRSELDKLVMYIGTTSQKKQVTIDDVRAVVQDAGAAELDDLIFAVGNGDAKRATQLLDRLFEEQTSPVAMLRSAQRHFMRLQWARHQVDQGANAADAVKRLQPPVFWKNQDAMAAQLRRWSRVKIEAALTKLFEAEAAVKRTGIPDQSLSAQLLLSLAA
jgi:DNA polymerase-3 subunit delta